MLVIMICTSLDNDTSALLWVSIRTTISLDTFCELKTSVVVKPAKLLRAFPILTERYSMERTVNSDGKTFYIAQYNILRSGCVFGAQRMVLFVYVKKYLKNNTYFASNDREHRPKKRTDTRKTRQVAVQHDTSLNLFQVRKMNYSWHLERARSGVLTQRSCVIYRR